MKSRRKNGRDGRKEEQDLANKITLKQQCERELTAWIKLVRHRKFPTDLKMQNEAALIARGIVIKMQVLKSEDGTDEIIQALAESIVRNFGQVWEKKSIILSGPDDGPIPVSATLTGAMNLTALEQAIKQDQER